MLKPLSSERWNFTTAAHLLNRAGFSGPPAEIEKVAAMGLEKAVAHFVDYETIPDDTQDPSWAKPDPERGKLFLAARDMSEEERRKKLREVQQSQRQHITELKGWWLERMAKGPRPLQEKLALFWHGHFATSSEKVKDGYLMWRQNGLFRRLAARKWWELLIEVGQNPAVLDYFHQA